MDAAGVAAPARKRSVGRRLADLFHGRPRLQAGALLAGPVGWLVIGYIGSLVVLLITAFWSIGELSGEIERTATLENFQTITEQEVYRDVAFRTIGIAAAVTVTDALLADLDVPLPALSQPSWVTAYSVAACHWQISLEDAACGLAWSWLENQLMVAAKLLPLGQTDVQRLTSELMPLIPAVIQEGLQVANDDIGMGMPGLVLGSMLHETQYSRLFRS